MDLKITPFGQTIVKPTALGPVANTDTKLLIYGLFQKGRVLAQDGARDRARFVPEVPQKGGNRRPGARSLSSFVFLDTTGFQVCSSLPVARPTADLSQPAVCTPGGPVAATRSPGVGSQPCGAKCPGFCADSKGV